MLRVLVAEDEAAVLAALQRQIEQEGHQVIPARDGAEALAALSAGAAVDVALIDIHMPGLNGVEVLKRIRASWPRVRLVAMSGVDEGLDEAIAGIDAISVLRKPFTHEQLLALLPQRRSGPTEDPRQTPVVFSPEEAEQIKQMFKTPGLKRFPCPHCGGELHSGTPMSGGSMALVWELQCSACHRSLVFSERR